MLFGDYKYQLQKLFLIAMTMFLLRQCLLKSVLNSTKKIGEFFCKCGNSALS
jgi:hypothetical protein